MKVSLEWLSEYVDIADLSPQQIADALTGAGLEVEAVEALGGKFSNVVVGKCEKLEPHPNADKLRLATINLGSETTKVVCGAPNLAEGMLIAFAKDGAQVINRKDGSVFVLGKATIRGVESSGMVCSHDELGLTELGLQDQYPKNADGGIWPLADYANESQLGEDLKIVLGLQGDTILHTAPTANRGDQMSMVGVAREVAALFDKTVKLPEIPQFSKQSGQPEIQIQLSNPEVCHYYGGLMLKGSKATPAPAWMSRRLEAAGIRSINAIVDVTNYVMLELGQPLHAFDQQKLAGTQTIGVRRAKPGEELITLDEVTHILTEQNVVITFDEKPVALGGVMGGQNTEIAENTTDILLEAACFDAASNRKSAKGVGIRTESSARFERGVDPQGVKNALFRAAQLIQELTGASYVGLVESPEISWQPIKISLRLERLEKIIGLKFDAQQVKQVLEPLGFQVEAKSPTEFSVTVPSWRVTDVTREIDLIEEVIRIHGYDHVPYTLPQKTVSVPFSQRQQLIDTIQVTLSGMGFHQVMTTSLIGPSLLEKTGMRLNEAELVTVINSHSVDHTMMRQSLLPNLLEVAKLNQSQGIDEVWVYELGKTYFKVGKPSEKQSGVAEKLYVSALMTGSACRGQWQKQPAPDFYHLKGAVENLLNAMFGKHLPALTFEADSAFDYLHPGKTAQVMLGGKPIGAIGELHPARQARLKFRRPVYLFELNVELLYKQLKQSAQAPKRVQLSPYQSVERDIALLVPAGQSHQAIVSILQGTGERLLKDITLFDEYKDVARLGEGNRSLAYRLTFQSDEQTLTDAMIDAAVQKLKQALTDKLPVQLR